MAKTVEQLKADIKALEDAGLPHEEEDAQLKQLVLASSAKAPASAKAPTSAPTKEEADFIPLNVESFRTGGGGWTAPATIGVKNAICEGYMVPEFVEDQLWFIFTSVPSASEPFRGALVCGALSGATGKGGAWKVKDVLDALQVPYGEDEARGGVKLFSAPKGKSCQVLWDDIIIKGKTERRIQDVMMPGAEAAM